MTDTFICNEWKKMNFEINNEMQITRRNSSGTSKIKRRRHWESMQADFYNGQIKEFIIIIIIIIDFK